MGIVEAVCTLHINFSAKVGFLLGYNNDLIPFVIRFQL